MRTDEGGAEMKRSSRIYVAIERRLLSVGMTLVAVFVERRLIRAMKRPA